LRPSPASRKALKDARPSVTRPGARGRIARNVKRSSPRATGSGPARATDACGRGSSPRSRGGAPGHSRAGPLRRTPSGPSAPGARRGEHALLHAGHPHGVELQPFAAAASSRDAVASGRRVRSPPARAARGRPRSGVSARPSSSSGDAAASAAGGVRPVAGRILRKPASFRATPARHGPRAILGARLGERIGTSGFGSGLAAGAARSPRGWLSSPAHARSNSRAAPTSSRGSPADFLALLALEAQPVGVPASESITARSRRRAGVPGPLLSAAHRSTP